MTDRLSAQQREDLETMIETLMQAAAQEQDWEMVAAYARQAQGRGLNVEAIYRLVAQQIPGLSPLEEILA